MENIVVITDGKGIKFDVVHGVFKEHFRRISFVELFLVENKNNLKTPLSREALLETIKMKLDFLATRNISEDVQYLCSIQRGYYLENGLWNLVAVSGTQDNNGLTHIGFTSTVPIAKDISDKKTKDQNLNMSDLLEEKYPSWKRKTSVFELLTGENEKSWIQESLRYCVKTLIK